MGRVRRTEKSKRRSKRMRKKMRMKRRKGVGGEREGECG